MIIAMLSDIHANIGALEACLAHARAHGAERFIFLGDFVGYGADPTSVVEIVQHYRAEGAVAVKGVLPITSIQARWVISIASTVRKPDFR